METLDSIMYTNERLPIREFVSDTTLTYKILILPIKNPIAERRAQQSYLKN